MSNIGKNQTLIIIIILYIECQLFIRTVCLLILHWFGTGAYKFINKSPPSFGFE
jgi:hypothetical protein